MEKQDTKAAPPAGAAGNAAAGERVSAGFLMALAPDFQNAVQRGGRNAKPLRHSNIVLYGFVHLVAADNQHMAAPQQLPRHVNPVLVFGGDGVIEEVRQIEDRDRSG